MEVGPGGRAEHGIRCGPLPRCRLPHVHGPLPYCHSGIPRWPHGFPELLREEALSSGSGEGVRLETRLGLCSWNPAAAGRSLLTAGEGLPLEECGGEGRASVVSVAADARAQPGGGVPPGLGPWGDCSYPPALSAHAHHTHTPCTCTPVSRAQRAPGRDPSAGFSAPLHVGLQNPRNPFTVGPACRTCVFPTLGGFISEPDSVCPVTTQVFLMFNLQV